MHVFFGALVTESNCFSNIRTRPQSFVRYGGKRDKLQTSDSAHLLDRDFSFPLNENARA